MGDFKRVQKFIDLKKFIPRGLKEVTPEMKAMIAGSAIQLTFGYPDVYFRYFWRILVYPDNYYSTITRKYHKGEVNIRGLVVLSWRSFKEGFMDSTDGRNLDCMRWLMHSGSSILCKTKSTIFMTGRS